MTISIIIIIYTSSHFAAKQRRGGNRARDLKSTIPHKRIQCPPPPRVIGYLDKAGWSERTVLAETGRTGHGIVVGGSLLMLGVGIGIYGNFEIISH